MPYAPYPMHLMKNILLCSDGSAFAENVYRYGAWFANRLEAEVNVLSVTDIRSQQVIPTADLSGSIGIDASEGLLSRLVELEYEKAKLDRQRAKLVLQQAAQILKAEGIDRINLLHETGFIVDCFAKFTANCNLAVLGKRGQNASFASGHLGANLERIIRSIYKPCLVTPQQFQPIERVAIAYDGSQTGQQILDFATHCPVFQGLEVHIVTISTNAEDSTAIAKLRQAEVQIRAAGIEPITSLLVGNPETAIPQYISDLQIGLLVMGAYGHSRIRHLVIGSTTAQILRSSQIPVLVYR